MCILMVPQNQDPYLMIVEHELKSLQQLVGGMIEIVEPFQDNVVIVCDENGRSAGKPVNRIINDSMDICGDFFLCGMGETELTDLPVEKRNYYKHKFRRTNLANQ